MKWIPVGLVAAVSTFIAHLQGPLSDVGFPGRKEVPDAWALLVPGFYGTVMLLIAGTIALAFHRVVMLGSQRELVTRMSLGESRADIVALARREGARLGLIWVSVGVIAILTRNQVKSIVDAGSMEQFAELFSWWQVLALVVIVAMGAATLAIIYGAVARSLTRGTPVEAALTNIADAQVGGWRARIRTLLLGTSVVISAFGWALTVAYRFAESPPGLFGSSVSPSANHVIENIGSTIAWTSGLAFVWWALRRTSALLTAVAARVLDGGTNTSGARTFAAAGLRHTSATWGRSATVMAAMMALMTAVAISAGVQHAVWSELTNGPSSRAWPMEFAELLPFLFLIAGGTALMVALVVASAKRRRSEFATMAALGADSTSLRAAPVLEGAIAALVAVVTGTAIGFIVAAITMNEVFMSNENPFAWSDAFGSSVAIMGATPWPLLALVGASTITAAAGGAFAFSFAATSHTPVEELKLAMKEGIS